MGLIGCKEVTTRNNRFCSNCGKYLPKGHRSYTSTKLKSTLTGQSLEDLRDEYDFLKMIADYSVRGKSFSDYIRKHKIVKYRHWICKSCIGKIVDRAEELQEILDEGEI